MSVVKYYAPEYEIKNSIVISDLQNKNNYFRKK